MFRKNRVSPKVKCKQFFLLLFSLVLCLQSLSAQNHEDSLSVVTVSQDSLLKRDAGIDSLHSNSNPTLGEYSKEFSTYLMSISIVDDNDFIGWVNGTKFLTTSATVSTGPVDLMKFQRPVWPLLVILVLFIGIGLVRIFFYINFHNIIFGFYNDRILTQINKEDSIGTSWPYIFLYSIFTLSLGLFITLYQSYVLKQNEVEFVNFIQISVGIALLFLLKIIFIRFVGILFQVEKLVREYVVFLYLFYFNSVLILMPLLLFVTFMPTSYFNFVLIFFLLIVLFLFIYRFFKTIFGLITDLRFSIFYLILYLCTLEIAPVLILVKSLNN